MAFPSPPLDVTPAWTNLSPRLRGVSNKRGRSYEFDRMETGTLTGVLDNRDSALSPENTSSPYAPLRSTRPTKLELVWAGVTYPAWQGIAEGYPQAFPYFGKDALVESHASDFFYALNRGGFVPGSTELTGALAVATANAEQFITVASTALPMPQVVPFTIHVSSSDVVQKEGTEDIEVLEILTATTYRAKRGTAPNTHPVGAAVTTDVVSFGEELSGTRIQNVLTNIGFSSVWWDLDAGTAVMAASEDLAGTNPLEHINLIAEAEFGRFFVSKAGKFTFRDRGSVVTDHLTPVVTFVDLVTATGAGTEIPFVLEGVLEHSEDKLYNRVKITIPDGTVVDLKDQTSIDEHFERLFEKSWPYANVNYAEQAARRILASQSEQTLRIPTLAVKGALDPNKLWPLLLPLEIGDRCRFKYQPQGGGALFDKQVIIEGISHSATPEEHIVRFQLTEVDPNQYWILGVAGYSELGQTTVLG
jgi:hypothetical protein